MNSWKSWSEIYAPQPWGFNVNPGMESKASEIKSGPSAQWLCGPCREKAPAKKQNADKSVMPIN